MDGWEEEWREDRWVDGERMEEGVKEECGKEGRMDGWMGGRKDG